LWPTTVMEILFAGAFLSLLADIGGRASEFVRRYGAGLVVAAAVVLSIADLATGWGSSLGAIVHLQPIQEPFASLYVVDRYTTFTAFTALVIGLAVAVYSMLYFKSGRRGPFFALFSILLCCLVGVVSAGDLLTLFLFWEGMTVSAYGLVTFGKAPLSMEAGIKYFLMAGIGSLIALYGIAAVYFSTGSILLQTIGGSLATGYGQLGLSLLVLGLGVEAAVVPLHTWLPDVYSASPIPTASIVSGAVTGVAVFGIFKVVQPLVPGGGIAPAGLPLASGAGTVQLILGSLALLTMLVGNLSALVQGDIRRMLSFSSIAQTGYMLAAISTMSVAGLVAAVFTIWNHGLLKSNFFMVVGKGSSSTESSQLEALRGTGRSDRPAGFMLASSSLALMGAPPFGMFWSEILVVQSLLLAGAASGTLFYVLAAAVTLNIVLSIGYYFRVINTVVFGDAQGSPRKGITTDILPPAALLALSVLTGVAPFLILGVL
jgi:F420H2 dehydrogenase subunit N